MPTAGAGAGVLGGPATDRAWRATVRRHIDEIPPAEWDSLLDPADVQLSHRFVKVCQDADIEGAQYRHILLYDGEGLAGIATLSFMKVALELLASSRVRGLVEALRRARPSFLHIPVLFCGLPVSFGRPCIRFRHDADGIAGLALLCRTMNRIGDELGAEVFCFKEFSPHEEVAVRELESLGYLRAASLPSCHLPLRWDSFGDYLADMRAGYRRQVRHTLRVRQRTGLDVRVVEDFGNECPDMHRLYAQVMDRAEFQLEHLNPEYFELLNHTFPTEARAILARREGELLAFAVTLEGGDSIAFLLAGADHGCGRDCQAYLNTVTEVVAEAIGGGSARLEMGQTSYDIKRRLGAVTEPRYLYIRHRHPMVHRMLSLVRNLVFPDRAFPSRRVFRDS